MVRRLVIALVLAAGCMGAQGALAQADPSCVAIGPLRGPALSDLTLPVPVGGQEGWVIAHYNDLPVVLPLDLSGRGTGRLTLPRGLELDQPESVTVTLVGLNGDGLVWLCDDLTMEILPPAPDPGATRRLAAQITDLAARFDALLPNIPPEHASAAMLPIVAPQLQALAAELSDFTTTASAQDIALLDAGVGAVLRTQSSVAPPTPAQSGLFGRPQILRMFFLNDLRRTSPGDIAPDRDFDLCPRGPMHLTQLIDLGVKANVNALTSQQIYLNLGGTLASVSARMINSAVSGNRHVDLLLDKGTGALLTGQALLSDYLAGMTPLNLERLNISHSVADFYDDTPQEELFIDITRAVLHTRSDGWSPTKAAFDATLGLMTLKTGGVAGKGAEEVSSNLRAPGQELSELVADAASKTRIFEKANRDLATLVKLEIDMAGHRVINVPALRRVNADVYNMRDFRNAAWEAAEAAKDAATQAAGPARAPTLAAETVDAVIAPTLGVIEGVLQGQTSTDAAKAVAEWNNPTPPDPSRTPPRRDLTPVGKIVSRCDIDMLRNEDGSKSRHLIYDTVEGGARIVHGALGDRPGFDVVDAGKDIARVRLNPALEYFPITRRDRLPEDTFPVSVTQISARLAGLPMVVQAGIYEITASFDGVINDPPTMWEVEPPLPFTVTGGQGGDAISLTIPDELPDDTLITVRIRAFGDFISASKFDPVWAAVAQKRKPDEEDEENDKDGFTCDLPPAQLVRRIPAESLLIGSFLPQGFSQTRAVPLSVDGEFASTTLHHFENAISMPPLQPTLISGGWGSGGVYRLNSFAEVEQTFAAQSVRPPATPWGRLADWVSDTPEVEIYALGQCTGFAFVKPGVALVMERPFYDVIPSQGILTQEWVMNFYFRE